VVASVVDYYTDKLTTHGNTPRGVDWSSAESQQLRFEQLLRVVNDGSAAPCTVLDYGCGYGALAQQLLGEERRFRYVGFDVCTPMVQAARAAQPDSRCVFSDREAELPQVDYTVASGIFNVRLEASEAQWQEHIEATLTKLAEHSRSGFAFNMLSRYADGELMRDYLYYADPGRYFRLCKERWSRNVALLHDYELYEFTVIVRLDSRPKPLVP
jgi:SAM-dependent methyltransferase